MAEETVVDTYPGCTGIRHTEKAVLVRIPALGGEFWIPQRQIAEESDVWQAGTSGKLVIAGWWGLRLLKEADERRKGGARG